MFGTNREFGSKPKSPVNLIGVASRVGQPLLLGSETIFPVYQVRGTRMSQDENSESVRIGPEFCTMIGISGNPSHYTNMMSM